MEILSLGFDSAILLLMLCIPGFVSMKVWSLIVPTRNKKLADYLLEALSYSVFNFASLLWLIDLVTDGNFKENNPVLFYLAFFFIFFLLPGLWPFLLKYILQHSKVAGKVFLNPIPTAWDHFFVMQEPCFILLHLTNGNMVGGLFIDESYASSFPHKQDIYIAEVWKINENGEFIEKIDQTMGILIERGKIEYMEFFSIDDERSRVTE